MKLHQSVKKYYYENIDELSDDKKFHFASRLAAWNGEAQAYDLLSETRGYLLPKDVPLQELFSNIISRPAGRKRTAKNYRLPYYEKYPLILGLHSALFRARHLKAVWDIDTKDALFSAVPQVQFQKLYTELANDKGALRILSTVGVNYMYLYKNLLNQRGEIDPELFINAAQDYDLSDPVHVKLKIYLYTHSIIGETNFYTEPFPNKSPELFSKMLKQLEKMITERFNDISLDSKLEFLVCCRICRFETPLFKKVYDECQNSLSPSGCFLIDKHNQNAKTSPRGISGSEHRNVLFIMSSSEFHPHKTLIDS